MNFGCAEGVGLSAQPSERRLTSRVTVEAALTVEAVTTVTLDPGPELDGEW